jgi:2-keto-4-pentenoate hydratase/2-oxohepta-3-ene-1,7-dioic acid hydratase in catechol pathway
MRFGCQDVTGFGTIEDDLVTVWNGVTFDRPVRSRRTLALADARLLTPCTPGKLVGLWNNFRARASKEGLTRPEHPLYFIKADNWHAADRTPIRQPARYDGPDVFEGELGVVIGRRCSNVSVEDAERHIFGYTCLNDVTARDVLKRDPSFVQWARAKSFDTVGPFGPWIVSGIDADALTVRTLVNGTVKQDYPVADMFYRRARSWRFCHAT